MRTHELAARALLLGPGRRYTAGIARTQTFR